MVFSLVAQGLGASLVHRFIAEAFAGRLEIRPFAPAIAFEYGLVFPSTHPLSKVAADCVETLRATATPLAASRAPAYELPARTGAGPRPVLDQAPALSAAGSRLSGSVIG